MGFLTPKEYAAKFQLNEEHVRQACLEKPDTKGNVARLKKGWIAEKVGGRWRIHAPNVDKRDDPKNGFLKRTRDLHEESLDDIDNTNQMFLEEAHRLLESSPGWLDKEMVGNVNFLAQVWKAELQRFIGEFPKKPTALDSFKYNFLDSKIRSDNLRKLPAISTLREINSLISQLALCYKFAELNQKQVSISVAFGPHGKWSSKLVSPVDEPLLACTFLKEHRLERILEYWIYELQEMQNGKEPEKKPPTGYNHCINCAKKLIKGSPSKAKLFCNQKCQNTHRKWINRKAKLLRGNNLDHTIQELGASILAELTQLKT